MNAPFQLRYCHVTTCGIAHAIPPSRGAFYVTSAHIGAYLRVSLALHAFTAFRAQFVCGGNHYLLLLPPRSLSRASRLRSHAATTSVLWQPCRHQRRRGPAGWPVSGAAQYRATRCHHDHHPNLILSFFVYPAWFMLGVGRCRRRLSGLYFITRRQVAGITCLPRAAIANGG